MAGQLLFNLLIAIMPVFLYQVLLVNRQNGQETERSQWLFGLTSGVAAVLCMRYPIVAGSDFLWDLRWVPFLIAHLYGGVRGGALVLLFSIGYRGYLGGGLAFYTVVIDAVLLSAATLFLRIRFHRWERARKLWGSMWLSIASYVLVMGSIFVYFASIDSFSFVMGQSWWLYAFMGVSHLIGVTVSLFLIENAFETARMRDEIQKAEKLHLISQLAASVAHEVRNPLTVVRGFIQLARTNMDDKNREYMDTAISELDRAEFIIGDYLNFAKPELGHPEVVDVAQSVHSVAEIMSPFALMHGVKLTTQLESELNVCVDPSKFKQVLMNLIKNSVEAIQVDGMVQVSAARHEGQVLLQVIDNGKGMTPEEVDRLGQPFYSTKEKGTGLGLMVTFRLVEAMNGNLKFHSEKDRGTEASIQLPVYVR